MGKKYTPSGSISPKRGNKNFYKGKGGKKYGKPDQHGQFQLRPEGKPTWLIPDLTESKVWRPSSRVCAHPRSVLRADAKVLPFARQLKPYVQWSQVEQRPELTPPPILTGRRGQPPIYPHLGGGPFVPAGGEAEPAPTAVSSTPADATTATAATGGPTVQGSASPAP